MIKSIKYKYDIPSREQLLKFLERIGKPTTHSNLLKKIKLSNIASKGKAEAIHRRLRAMIRDGQLFTDRRGRYVLVKQLAVKKGFIISHRDGYGFLVPIDGGEHLFVNPNQMKTLFPGDQVLARAIENPNNKKQEAIIIEVLQRGFSKVIGRYQVSNDVELLVPANRNLSKEIIIIDKAVEAKDGDYVLVKIVDYGSVKFPIVTGKILKNLGETITTGLATEIAINNHNLPNHWSKEVTQEAAELNVEMLVSKHRRDLRGLPFVTIDGSDAKDFDDAVYCENLNGGGKVLYVAIADVSEYVKAGGALDVEASRRGNSVYFTDLVIPMLPEVLANNLCSLKPKKDRLVVVSEIHLDTKGKISKYCFYEAVISSWARLTYDEVYNWLENITVPDKINKSLLEQLKSLKELYELLLKKRKARGTIEFSNIEPQISFDKNGKVEAIEPISGHYVHGIIEECMLLANVCASEFLTANRALAIYRNHEKPDPEKLKDLRIFLHGLGLTLKGADSPAPKHYAELLAKVVGRKGEAVVQVVLLRSLKRALYSVENLGHFGLAYSSYVHFTSPIRRYPDLLNHRLIKAVLANHKTIKNDYKYNIEEVSSLARHCSYTERRADEATREVVAWCKCEYLKNKIGNIYQGVISGVTSFGVFVELSDILVEGLVHITSLKNDYYQFDSARQKLVGKRSGATYQLGDQVKIVVSRVSPEELVIIFDLAD